MTKISTTVLSFLVFISLTLTGTKINAQLKAGFTVYSDSVCTQILDSFHNTTTGGILPYTFLWDYGNKSRSNAFNGYANYASSGIYAIKLRVTDAKGNKDSITKTIVVLNSPKADYTVYRNGCGPVNFVAKEDSSSPIAISKYMWVGEGSPGHGPLFHIGDSTAYQYISGGIYHYNLVVTGNNGCTATYSDSFNMATYPGIILPYDTSVCTNTAITITARPIDGTPPYTIWWGHKSANITGITIHPTIEKDTAFGVFLLDAIGCYNYDSIAIHAYPLPNAHWSLHYKVDSVEFKAKEIGLNDSSYTWYIPYDHNLKLIRKYGPIVGIVFPTDTIFDVTLMVTDKNECSSYFDSTINVAKLGIMFPVAENNSFSVFPNPFHNSTIIQYSLSQKSHVQIGLFDITGKQIAFICNEIRQPGNYQLPIDASKYNLNPGIYTLKLITDEGIKNLNIVKL